MADHDRYHTVGDALPRVLPPITRAEAERAARRLWRKFAPKKPGRTSRPPPVRRCWISTKPTDNDADKGWARLIHDISHRVFRRVYSSTRRPHDPLHVRYETDIAAYVAQSGWLDGSLKPKEKPKLSTDEKRAKALVATEALIKKWESKQRRAANALKKLKRKLARLQKWKGTQSGDQAAMSPFRVSHQGDHLPNRRAGQASGA